MNKNIHVLLVEDNEGDIVLTREALSTGTFINRLSVVRDGEEALKFITKAYPFEGVELPNMILLDINLPKIDGKEVLEFVKKSEKLRHIPVVMLTTSSAPSDILDSYNKQANCYITKPIELDKFFDVVSSVENFWLSVAQLPQP